MGSKFMVLKLKDIVKTALFAVLGIVFFALVINGVFGDKGEEKDVYMPGTYSSEISLPSGNLSVELKVGKNKIKSVSVTDTTETIPVFYPLFESTAEIMEKQIVEAQGTDFALKGDAPYTEQMILEAVEKNLEKAKKSLEEQNNNDT